MQQKRPFTEWERKEWMRLHSEAIEQYLQKGRGSCWLRNTTIVEIVTGALRFFEGTKFRLYAWCIMPNHVHVIMQPLGNYSVSSILHSWKTFSAKEANKVLNRNGRFWHAEYFDKLIRSEEQLRICIRYVWDNPEKAGWSEWKWRWKIREDQLLDRNTGL